MAKKSTKAAPKKKQTIYFNSAKSLKISPATFLERVQKDLKHNQSIVSIILGILIIVVLGFSIFNFINKSAVSKTPVANTPAQQTITQKPVVDVSKNNLPGKYTVKSGDTLFQIAEKYYNDGYQYPELAKTNNISNPDVISIGQVLEIPKLANSGTTTQAAAQITPSANPQNLGTGGSATETEWGPRITPGSTYTVQDGDWLSKIAGRAYGDIYQFNKIAQANNISDPNTIEPGMVIKIPQ